MIATNPQHHLMHTLLVPAYKILKDYLLKMKLLVLLEKGRLIKSSLVKKLMISNWKIYFRVGINIGKLV